MWSLGIFLDRILWNISTLWIVISDKGKTFFVIDWYFASCFSNHVSSENQFSGSQLKTCSTQSELVVLTFFRFVCFSFLDSNLPPFVCFFMWGVRLSLSVIRLRAFVILYTVTQRHHSLCWINLVNAGLSDYCRFNECCTIGCGKTCISKWDVAFLKKMILQYTLINLRIVFSGLTPMQLRGLNNKWIKVNFGQPNYKLLKLGKMMEWMCKTDNSAKMSEWFFDSLIVFVIWKSFRA